MGRKLHQARCERRIQHNDKSKKWRLRAAKKRGGSIALGSINDASTCFRNSNHKYFYTVGHNIGIGAFKFRGFVVNTSNKQFDTVGF
jgi:hypothetical protein